MVAAAAERSNCVAHRGAAEFEGAVPTCIAVEHVPEPLHKHRRKRGHSLGRLLDVKHAMATLLVLADHIQVDGGHGARQSVLAIGQIGIGTGHLRHPQEANAAAGRWQRPVVDQALQGSGDLDGCSRAGSVVVGRRLRVAKMRHHQHLLIALAGDERGHDFERAVVERADHLGAHAHGQILAQPAALARCQDKTEAARLVRTPPKRGVLARVGQVQRAAAGRGGRHAVEKDASRAAPPHRQVVNASQIAVGQHQLARHIQSVVMGVLRAVFQDNHLVIALCGRAALDDGHRHRFKVTQSIDSLLALQQVKRGPRAGPFLEALHGPEGSLVVGRVAQHFSNQPGVVQLRLHIGGRGAVARAGLDAVMLADVGDVPLGPLAGVGDTDRVQSCLKHGCFHPCFVAHLQRRLPSFPVSCESRKRPGHPMGCQPARTSAPR